MIITFVSRGNYLNKSCLLIPYQIGFFHQIGPQADLVYKSQYVHHPLCETCHISHVTYHMSHVTCHMSHVTYFIYFFFCKFMEVVCGGSVINWAYPVQLLYSSGRLNENYICLKSLGLEDTFKQTRFSQGCSTKNIVIN